MALEHVLKAVLLGLVLAVLVGASHGVVGYELWMHRAEVLRADLEYGRALDALDRAAAIRHGAALPRLRAGEILVAQGRWEEAEGALDHALALDPDSAAIWHALGQTSLGRGEEEEAERRWWEALARDPAYREAWLALGKVYISRSEWDRATQAFERAISGGGTRRSRAAEASALYLHGLIQAWQDRERAMGDLEQARARAKAQLRERSTEALAALEGLDTPPVDSRDWAELGQLYLALDEPEMAFHALERGLETGGESPRLRAYLGYAAWRLGRQAEAAGHLRAARRQDPEDPLPLYFLALLYRSRGQRELAIQSLQAALNRDPQNPAFYAELGDLLHEAKEYVSAREAYLRATEAAPWSAEFHLLRAEYHISTLLWIADAVNSGQAAVALSPEEPLGHEYLGWALYLSGELEAAEQSLIRAVVLDATSARAQYRLGIVRIAMGKTEEARHSLLRGVDLDSEGTYRRRAELVLGRLDKS